MENSIYISASGTYDETYVAHRIIDIAPTIAELVGVRPPENAEGEVIRQIFEEVKAETPPPRTSPLIYVGAVVVIVTIIAAVLIIKKPF
jgi:arylsulfatase A-like enzyme